MSAASVSQSLYNRRRVTNAIALLLSCVAALFGLFFLAWILWTLLSKGVPGIDLNLFTKMTPPPMQEGGLLNAFFGSAVMCGLALAIGTPLGIAAGTWLAEYGNARKTGVVVRFVNDIPVIGAIDRVGSVRLHLVRDADRRALLCIRRCAFAGLHRAAGRGAYHRRNAAAGAGADA